MKAIAVYQGKLGGYVAFRQESSNAPVRVSGHLSKLSPGKHGIHIHQYGNLLSSDCMHCGGHFNPNNTNHGSRTSPHSHAGDFGNITADEDKQCRFHFTTDKISLYSGKLCVIGRSLVIHEDEDDLGKGGHDDSLTTGHSGKRIDCAVIGLDQ